MGGGASVSGSSPHLHQYFEKIEACTKVAVGKEVVADGKVGEVRSVMHMYEVVFPDGTSDVYRPENITLATSPGESAEGDQNSDDQAATQQEIGEAESKMLGVSLAWVCDRLHDVAWERIQAKQALVLEKTSKDKEETVDKILKAKEEDLKDFNFYDLDPVLAHTQTGIGYGKICPRDRQSGCSIVDGLHSSGYSSRASVFMSWVWTYTLLQVTSALSNWHRTHNTEQRKTHHFIWWCFCCNNQYRLNEHEEESPSLAEVFGGRLVAIGKMIISLDTLFNPKYYTRAWCLFEIWVAWQQNVRDLQVALSDDGVNTFKQSLAKGSFDLVQNITIDSQQAVATKKADLDFIMKQMQGRHAEVDNTAREALFNLVSALVKDYSPKPTTIARIQTMIECLEEGRRQAKRCRGKDLVVFIGSTGSGKSTTINALRGCQMQRVKKAGLVKVEVAPTSQIEEVTPIGHFHQSETLMPILVESDGLCLCDGAGFMDRRGSDISVSNTVNLHHVLKAAASTKFVVLAAYPTITIDADRGKGLDDLLQLLFDLFGSTTQLKENKESILLCITKAPRQDEDGEVTQRSDITTHFKSRRDLRAYFHDDDLVDVLYDICHRCVVFHPIEKPHTTWVDKHGLRDAILNLTPIQVPSDTCILVPNSLETITLRKSFRSCGAQLEEACRLEEYKQAVHLIQKVVRWHKLLFTDMRLHHDLLELQIEGREMVEEKKIKLKRADVELELEENDFTIPKKTVRDNDIIDRIQDMVDKTFMGWGHGGPYCTTRDRQITKNPVATRLKVEEVIHIENAEKYMGYQARRGEIAQIISKLKPGEMAADYHGKHPADWDIKTRQVSFKKEPCDKNLNECWLWHGTSGAGANGIADSGWNISRAGAATGTLCGRGVYLFESALKADEYTRLGREDGKGWSPLLLCRVCLGRVNYCDAKSPWNLITELEESVDKVKGKFHAVLCDREVCRGTFREFVVYDEDQVYPEYIVWYSRVDPMKVTYPP